MVVKLVFLTEYQKYGRNLSLNLLECGQGWEFNLLIFWSSIFSIFKKYQLWLNRFCWSFKKINHDQLALFDLLKGSTVSKSDHRTSWQGWEFDLSIFWSFWSLKKIDCDRITLVDFLKRLTVIELILSIFKKVWPWANGSHRSLKKIKGSDSIFFTMESIFRSQKRINSIKTQWSNSQPWMWGVGRLGVIVNKFLLPVHCDEQNAVQLVCCLGGRGYCEHISVALTIE